MLARPSRLLGCLKMRQCCSEFHLVYNYPVGWRARAQFTTRNNRLRCSIAFFACWKAVRSRISFYSSPLRCYIVHPALFKENTKIIAAATLEGHFLLVCSLHIRELRCWQIPSISRTSSGALECVCLKPRFHTEPLLQILLQVWWAVSIRNKVNSPPIRIYSSICMYILLSNKRR